VVMEALEQIHLYTLLVLFEIELFLPEMSDQNDICHAFDQIMLTYYGNLYKYADLILLHTRTFLSQVYIRKSTDLIFISHRHWSALRSFILPYECLGTYKDPDKPWNKDTYFP
jgi:hypothetical protein